MRRAVYAPLLLLLLLVYAGAAPTHPWPEDGLPPWLQRCGPEWARRLAAYADVHAEARRALRSGRPARIVIFRCAEGDRCGGLGDRLVGLASAFLFALRTDRAFFIAWPGLSDVMLPAVPGIDWRWTGAMADAAGPRTLVRMMQCRHTCIWASDPLHGDGRRRFTANALIVTTNRGPIWWKHSANAARTIVTPWLAAAVGAPPGGDGGANATVGSSSRGLSCLYRSLLEPGPDVLRRMAAAYPEAAAVVHATGEYALWGGVADGAELAARWLRGATGGGPGAPAAAAAAVAGGALAFPAPVGGGGGGAPDAAAASAHASGRRRSLLVVGHVRVGDQTMPGGRRDNGRGGGFQKYFVGAGGATARDYVRCLFSVGASVAKRAVVEHDAVDAEVSAAEAAARAARNGGDSGDADGSGALQHGGLPPPVSAARTTGWTRGGARRRRAGVARPLRLPQRAPVRSSGRTPPQPPRAPETGAGSGGGGDGGVAATANSTVDGAAAAADWADVNDDRLMWASDGAGRRRQLRGHHVGRRLALAKPPPPPAAPASHGGVPIRQLAPAAVPPAVPRRRPPPPRRVLLVALSDSRPMRRSVASQLDALAARTGGVVRVADVSGLVPRHIALPDGAAATAGRGAGAQRAGADAVGSGPAGGGVGGGPTPLADAFTDWLLLASGDAVITHHSGFSRTAAVYGAAGRWGPAGATAGYCSNPTLTPPAEQWRGGGDACSRGHTIVTTATDACVRVRPVDLGRFGAGI